MRTILYGLLILALPAIVIAGYTTPTNTPFAQGLAYNTNGLVYPTGVVVQVNSPAWTNVCQSTNVANWASNAVASANETGATHTAQISILGPLATNAYASATNAQARVGVLETNSVTPAQLVGATNALPYVLRAGDTMSGTLTMGSNDVSGSRFGPNAGSGAIGSDRTNDNYLAVGVGAAANLFGGNNGENWTAIGNGVGIAAMWTNSVAMGRGAGCKARGSNRLYIDVYSNTLQYSGVDLSTNDTIFLDSNGVLYLGGGAQRSENPSAGGVLRGVWNIGAPTGSGALLTGISNVGTATNATTVTGSQSNTIAVALTNGGPVHVAATNAQTVATNAYMIATNAQQIATNSLQPFQAWTATLTPPISAGTSTLVYAHGTLPFLSCTGAQTVAWSPSIGSSGWQSGGINRQRLALWVGSFSVTIESNATVTWAAPISLSTSKTNHIIANISAGVGYTNVVLYPLTAQ